MWWGIETKRVLFWVSEKIEFEWWVMGDENWVMSDEWPFFLTKQALNLQDHESNHFNLKFCQNNWSISKINKINKCHSSCPKYWQLLSLCLLFAREIVLESKFHNWASWARLRSEVTFLSSDLLWMTSIHGEQKRGFFQVERERERERERENNIF